MYNSCVESDAYQFAKEVAMLNVMEDITSVARLRENLDSIVARVKEDGGPLVITEDGEAAVVLLSAEEYQRLVELTEVQEIMAIAGDRAGDVTDLEEGIALFYKEANLKPPAER
jgi:prevent-host-death family protein